MTMTQLPAAKSPAQIRELRARHPEMRERDFARIHAISEAELVAAQVGTTAIRLRPDVDTLLNGLQACGEVMALTRNESAVHEKIGPVEKVVIGARASMVLGEQIDLRVFPSRWAFGFAVEKAGEAGAVRRSLQFFDPQGMAIHKVHARPDTNTDAWNELIDKLRHAEQDDAISPAAPQTPEPKGEPGSLAELRERWSAMTDTHQFFGLLQALNLPRLDALEMVGDDYAFQLDHAAVASMFDASVAAELPIMAFVGNSGCIQIHSGPVKTIKTMGPWLNVMDDTFHLHLRLDQIASVWAVRKPTSDGHVSSVEVYDADRELIIQFFGKRQEGHDERAGWRAIVEALPLFDQSNAA
ncbi:ChuX/HutX family heme-like substrate-binding protein [Devosia neptuniae]|uniref:hemin-degrading factor n=1 Tax=Devosia TaxID=46913 RepID=UPI0022AECCAA|nr:ChuX/HutX family heme-like substrate-binding protein [Devosia neptuniae]MCZ4346202.1 hemin-degrading factor [Devosia neptuniae]